MAAEGPADVDGVVFDQCLQLGVVELVGLDSGGQVLTDVLIGSYCGGAADADDPAVTSCEVFLAGPDLAVEVVEISVPAKDCLRWWWRDPEDVLVRGLATGMAGVVVGWLGPP